MRDKLPDDIDGISDYFRDLLRLIFNRYPNFVRAIYTLTYLFTFLYFWLVDNMVWWSAMIFSVFLTLIIATSLILILHFGYKWINCFKYKL